MIARPFFRPPAKELRYLPECPRKLRGARRLAWVAIQHGADAKEGSLNVLDLATLDNRTYPLPGRPGFFVETEQDGVLLIGLERRLVLFDLPSAQITATLAHLPDDSRVIINDGIAVPNGVIFGTKDLRFQEPIAALWHYGSDGLRKLLDGQTCSNGKYFRDGMLIDIDTQPKTITEYRYEAGKLEKVRLIVPPERLPAFPDGMKATPDGQCLVIAFYNPANVPDGLAQQIRISDGEVVAEWVIPGSPRVTCPEWIDGQWLFTTAVEGMDPEAPQAGTMFVGDAV